MRYIWIPIFAVFVIADLCSAQNAKSGEKPDTATIQKWIANLDSRSFKTRDKAEKELIKLGKTVQPILADVIQKSKSLELARRAQMVLDKIRQKTLDDISGAARLATAVVEGPIRAVRPGAAGIAAKTSLATAFCIHPSGIFVSSYNAVRFAKNNAIPIVIYPGTPKQKILKAKIVRSDTQLKLSILQVQGKHNLPCVKLGSTKGLSELSEIFAICSPGAKIAINGKNTYPTIAVSPGFVCSMQMSAGVVNQFQFHSDDNRATLGGPLLNKTGEVVGIYALGNVQFAAGVRPGARVATQGAFAIPIEGLSSLLDQPIVQFFPPTLTQDDVHKPCEFQARVAFLLPKKKMPDLDLLIVSGNIIRRIAMTEAKGEYRAKAVPIPAPTSPTSVRVSIKTKQGRIVANMDDYEIKVGSQTMRLSALQYLKTELNSVTAMYANGKTATGKLTGIDTLSFVVGGVRRQLKIRSADIIAVEPPANVGQMSCCLVIRTGTNDTVVWQGTIPVQQQPKQK